MSPLGMRKDFADLVKHIIDAVKNLAPFGSSPSTIRMIGGSTAPPAISGRTGDS
jgi:hypothetical protein